MRGIFVLIVLVHISISGFGQASSLKDFKLIGNATGVQSLTATDFSNVFKGRLTRWGNSRSVILCLPSANNETADDVATLVYNTSVKGMQKFWLTIVFQGRANPPVVFDTDAEMINYIKKTPGSIALVSSSVECPKEFIISLK